MKKYILIIVAIISIYCIACKDKKVEPHYDIVYFDLKDKPLGTIKNYIKGKWKMHYSSGGIAGPNFKNYYSNTFVEFIINPSTGDSIKWYNDTAVYSNGNAIFNKAPKFSNNTDSVYEIKFIILPRSSTNWIADQIQKDTLIVGENAFESLTYFLTKVK